MRNIDDITIHNLKLDVLIWIFRLKLENLLLSVDDSENRDVTHATVSREAASGTNRIFYARAWVKKILPRKNHFSLNHNS